MIQAVKHPGTKKQAGICEQGVSAGIGRDQFSCRPIEMLSFIVSAAALAGVAWLAFHAAHVLATQCTSASVIDLMRACGTQIVVR